MPTVMSYSDTVITFAPKKEVLEYANKIREAGGANALDALLPSNPGSPSSCLIANALNFGCSVVPTNHEYADGSDKWVMITPDDDLTRRLAQVVSGRAVRYDEDDCELTPGVESNRLVLLLPKRIGNAAFAFDVLHPEFAEFRR